MKTFRLWIAATLLCLVSAACSTPEKNGILPWGNKTIQGSHQYVTKKINLDSFTQLQLNGSPNVIFTQKPGQPQVSIYTSDNLVDLLDIYVEHHTLHIGFQKNISVKYDQLIIEVTAPQIDQIAVSGSGEVQITQPLSTQIIRLKVSGSGSIKGEKVASTQVEAIVTGSGDITLSQLTAASVQAQITGSGDITFSGRTQAATYSITGSGDLQAEKLIAEKVKANITGSGDIRCQATQSLQTHITGSGEIGYLGNPQLETNRKNIYRL